MDELAGVDGQTLVLLELGDQAVDLLGLGLGAAVGERGPVLGGLVADDVLAVVEQLRVGILRARVQHVAVGGALDRRGQQPGGVECQVAGERFEPAVGGELRGPGDVECHHVEFVIARLQRLHQTLTRVVGLAGQFDDLDLFVGVGLVPRVDDRADDVEVVLSHGERDGAAAIEVLAGRVVGAVTVVRAGREHQR